jgi:hypothetical protein
MTVVSSTMAKTSSSVKGFFGKRIPMLGRVGPAARTLMRFGKGTVHMIIITFLLDQIIDSAEDGIIRAILDKIGNGEDLTAEEQATLDLSLTDQASKFNSQLTDAYLKQSDERQNLERLESVSYEAERTFPDHCQSVASFVLLDREPTTSEREAALLGLRIILTVAPSMLADDDNTRRAIGLSLLGAGANVALDQPYAIGPVEGLTDLDGDHELLLQSILHLNSDLGRCTGVVTEEDLEFLQSSGSANESDVLVAPLSSGGYSWLTA